MAFFNIRQWLDRISEHPNRRTLTNVNDPTDVQTYDLSRAEGTVSVQGTALTAANLNDLEGRIASAFTAVDNAMPEANPAEEATGSLTKLKVGGTVYEVEGGGTTIEKITKAEWDAMTAEERAAFIGVVEDTNADYVPLTAENIPFDSNDSIAEKVNSLTAEDLSYDGGTITTKQKIDENASDISGMQTTLAGKYGYSYKSSAVDLNDIKDNGIYSFYNPTNRPYTGNAWAQVIVIRAANEASYATQICLANNNTPTLHIRVCTNGVWQSWVQVV